MIRKQDADILIWIAAMFSFAAVYVWNPPGPKYLPIEGVWQWEAVAGVPAMSWFARLGWALLASFCAGLAVKLLCRVFGHTDKALSPKIIYTLTLFIAIVYFCTMVYIAQHEFVQLSNS